MDIELDYINRSNDTTRTSVFFFLKNEVPGVSALDLAWKVIKACGKDDHHPFTLPYQTGVSVRDGYGNFTRVMQTEAGQRWVFKETPSGHRIKRDGLAVSPTTVEVANVLDRGAISVVAYKDDAPLVEKTGIAPQQNALFRFTPTLFVGAASQVTPAQPIKSIVVTSTVTELSLTGVKSADIVMTGGGAGPQAQPFSFCLENVVMN